MTRILILSMLCLLSILSCKEKKPTKQNPINPIDSAAPDKKKVSVEKKDTVTVIIPTWKSVNDDLHKKYQTRIEFTDIERIYKLLLKEKLIDKKILIDDFNYPTFTHLSPKVMLDEVTLGTGRSDRPDEMRVFTPRDRDFILSQQKLRSTNQFKWSTLTNKIADLYSYPRVQIGIPVFSIDKNKCIVGIEEYKTKDCFTIISYLFVINGSQTKYYIFEKVTNCN